MFVSRFGRIYKTRKCLIFCVLQIKQSSYVLLADSGTGAGRTSVGGDTSFTTNNEKENKLVTTLATHMLSIKSKKDANEKVPIEVPL